MEQPDFEARASHMTTPNEWIKLCMCHVDCKDPVQLSNDNILATMFTNTLPYELNCWPDTPLILLDLASLDIYHQLDNCDIQKSGKPEL